MAHNPIAELLNLTPVRQDITINGRRYSYHAGSEQYGTHETLYLENAGNGVSNPGLTLFFVPATPRKMVLGQKIARREGVKRAEAEAIVDAAIIGLPA